MNIMTTGSKKKYVDVAGAIKKHGMYKPTTEGANDCLTVFIDNIAYCFFVDTIACTLSDIDNVFKEIDNVINDGFTKVDMFLDYGLDYIGDVAL